MPHVWHLTALQLNQKILITGTVLHGKSRLRHKPRTIIGNMIKVLLSYFRRPYQGKILHIFISDGKYDVMTNEKGYFSLLINKGNVSRVSIEDGSGMPLSMEQDYPVIHLRKENKIEVISDVDDTIFLSHTASLLKRIYTTLIFRPSRRKAIYFTNRMLKLFHAHDCRVTYLSKSEANLFGLIAAIINYNELPQGALLLTPYLKLLQLINPQKGKNYKKQHLIRIFDHVRSKRFVLFGDDSQRDMEIYRDLANLYGQRIVKIYIRQTGFTRNQAQLGYWEALKQTGVPVKYFDDTDDVESEIDLMLGKIQSSST